MAITTPIFYPSDYLPGPLKDSFGLKPVSPLKSTDMVTGRRRQRRAYTSVPTNTDIAWIFNDAQAQAFEAWFRDVLTDGSARFNMPLLTPVGLKITSAVLTISMKGPRLKAVSTGGIQRPLSYGSDRFRRLAGGTIRSGLSGARYSISP